VTPAENASVGGLAAVPNAESTFASCVPTDYRTFNTSFRLNALCVEENSSRKSSSEFDGDLSKISQKHVCINQGLKSARASIERPIIPKPLPFLDYRRCSSFPRFHFYSPLTCAEQSL
jgi:hypothetical protein